MRDDLIYPGIIPTWKKQTKNQIQNQNKNKQKNPNLKQKHKIGK